MASLIYNRTIELWARGNIDFDTDTFKVMLTTATYAENKATHAFRSDVTNEVTGTGYTAGGLTAAVSVALDTANNRLDITLGGVTWSGLTTTARKAVYYKSRGGAATADELVAVNDFGGDITTSNSTLQLLPSTFRITNA